MLLAVRLNSSAAVMKLHGDVIVAVPPSAPRNLQVVAKTDDSITITWEPPLENPGGRRISYNVYRSLDDDPRVFITNAVSASTLTITSK